MPGLLEKSFFSLKLGPSIGNREYRPGFLFNKLP